MKTLRMIRLLLSDNGVIWTACFFSRALLRRLVGALDGYLKRLEEKYKLAGEHSVAINYLVWQTYDWRQLGEEWTKSPAWKKATIDEVMLKYIEPGKTILEIGPGGGRWTEALQKLATRLVLVDLSEKCIALCKDRFAQCDNIEFYVNDGASLSFISDETVDYVWSLGVFVHINPRETEMYLAEFNRVLNKGGRGIIHHPRDGRVQQDGWRSKVTSEMFHQLLEKQGLTLVRQIDSWGNEKQGDVVTIFEKPLNSSDAEMITS
ncbi:MAG: class I SAM-dependent methyltransferase [Anaerolineae bacterium]|nr:class I SAM-dependent methyltransferase [Anaerolineae bacterium]